MCVYIYEYVCTHQVFICVYTSGELLSRLYMYKYVLHMCMCEYACIYVCIYDYMCVYIRYRGNEEFFFIYMFFYIYFLYIYDYMCVYIRCRGNEELLSRFIILRARENFVKVIFSRLKVSFAI